MQPHETGLSGGDVKMLLRSSLMLGHVVETLRGAGKLLDSDVVIESAENVKMVAYMCQSRVALNRGGGKQAFLK